MGVKWWDEEEIKEAVRHGRISSGEVTGILESYGDLRVSTVSGDTYLVRRLHDGAGNASFELRLEGPA